MRCSVINRHCLRTIKYLMFQTHPRNCVIKFLILRIYLPIPLKAFVRFEYKAEFLHKEGVNFLLYVLTSLLKSDYISIGLYTRKRVFI